MSFKLIYEYSLNDYFITLFMSFMLAFVGLLLLIFLKPENAKTEREYDNEMISKYIVSVIFMIGGTLSLILNARDVSKTFSLLKRKQYSVVEGYVSDFYLHKGKENDRFRVKNVKFECDHDIISQKNYDSGRIAGASLKDSMYVRVSYIPKNENYRILKIEERNHKIV